MIAPEIGGDLSPGLIVRLPDYLEGSWPECGAINERARFHGNPREQPRLRQCLHFACCGVMNPKVNVFTFSFSAVSSRSGDRSGRQGNLHQAGNPFLTLVLPL